MHVLFQEVTTRVPSYLGDQMIETAIQYGFQYFGIKYPLYLILLGLVL